MTYQVHTTYEKGNKIVMNSATYATKKAAEMHVEFSKRINPLNTVQLVDSDGNRISTYQRH